MLARDSRYSGPRLTVHAHLWSPRTQSLGAFGLYLAVAVLLLVHGLFGRPGFFIGRDTDPPQTMWFFKWWLFSLSHGLNPFITDWVWAPLGVNLAWTALVPLPSLISIPLQVTVGEPATYNIIVTLALPLAALSAFLLCRRVTGTFWPSMLGGYIFGFSPYMLDELRRHLNLVAVFPLPLIVAVVLRRLDGEIGGRRFAGILAALLVAQFLCSIELFATATAIGAGALILTSLIFDHTIRTRLRSLIVPIAIAYLIAAALLTPYLYALFAYGFPHGTQWPSSKFSADLVGLVMPREILWLSTLGPVGEISKRFESVFFQESDYLGAVLIIFIEVFRRRYWPLPTGKLLSLLIVAIFVAAMGPYLHVAGRTIFPLPWLIVERLPLISVALPMRLMMYAFLVVALMTAIWFAEAPVRVSSKVAFAILIFLSLAPNPNEDQWLSPLDLPAFFTEKLYARELSPREIVLPLPWGQRGNSMYWQSQSDMYFRMAGGYTGEFPPFEFQRMPVANYFYGGIDLPEAADQLKAYIVRFGVQAVVADPTEANFCIWQQTLASLDIAPLKEGGVWIYKIPPGSFAAYRKLSGAQLEARAGALRFDTILEAAAKYLAAGNDPAKISALELKRLNLLPSDWLADPTPHAYIDWQIGPASNGRIGIVIVGSSEGVEPLIDRYAASGAEIQYPAPTRWTRDSNPRRDVINPLLVIFDSAALQSAATEMRTSPPPERTTPFIQPQAPG